MHLEGLQVETAGALGVPGTPRCADHRFGNNTGKARLRSPENLEWLIRWIRARVKTRFRLVFREQTRRVSHFVLPKLGME
jgi:hypothetical protein